MTRRGGWQGAPPRTGFQRHHLIPIALLHRPQMGAMFDQLHAEGFALQHFARNGLMLPASEPAALSLGHALHRGPHRGYSDVVTARVERIRAHFAAQAAVDMRIARRVVSWSRRRRITATRRALTDRHGAGFWLNRRDPMRLFVDRPYLDEAIDKLFGE